MNAVVFVGPSLKVDEARNVLEADYRPPASQGDVYRAARDGARVIGLVDGFFEEVPAVWHKEFLWAMSRGVHVFGASSMGALRAAELAPFGMVGVGGVFEAFRDGRLEDDDEVTIHHGPAELGYPAVSEAMVNIRATLERAAAEGVIGTGTRQRVEAIAKALHYPQRTFDRILEAAGADGVAGVDALAEWLPSGRVDAKRDDALAMLHAIADLMASEPGPRAPVFHFEHTDAWEQLSRRTGRQVAAAIPETMSLDPLLEELRLDGAAYGHAMTAALARALALREAERQKVPVDRDRFSQVVNGFFVRKGVVTPEAIKAWLADQSLDAAGLTALMTRELQVGVVETLLRDEVATHLPDALRVGGAFGALARRAQRKQAWLAERGLGNAGVAETGLDEAGLLHWHFVTRQGGQVPADVDGYARNLGLENRFALTQALAREYLFVNRSPG